MNRNQLERSLRYQFSRSELQRSSEERSASRAYATSARAGRYRPQTNGKAERFIQTLLREWPYERPYKKSAHRRQRLHGWLRHYDENRPHGSLGGQSPIARLQVSAGMTSWESTTTPARDVFGVDGSVDFDPS